MEDYCDNNEEDASDLGSKMLKGKMHLFPRLESATLVSPFRPAKTCIIYCNFFLNVGL